MPLSRGGVEVMNNLLLPDLLAMAILLGVLLRVRRRNPQHDIRLWLAGLLLILLECVARILYGLPLPKFSHHVVHIVALDSYLLAGVLFLRSALASLQRLPRVTLFAALNTVPGLLLLTAYGAGFERATFYALIALLGAVLAVTTSVGMRRPPLYPFLMAAPWLPVAAAALLNAPRYAAYLLLAELYLAVAGAFLWSLPRRSSGRIAVVTGFAIWSACFATHPVVAEFYPAWSDVASEVWNMQKFLITVGFMLLLFESAVESNEWLALHDELTGLPNRRLFGDRISNAIARAERDHTSLILFCMDLNDFKAVNDTLGHDAGDALLRHVSQNLQQVVRRSDTLARMGGDEFTLLATDMKLVRAPRKELRWLRGEDEANNADTAAGEERSEAGVQDGQLDLGQHAARIEQDIRAAVNRPLLIQSSSGARTVEVSVSIGVALYPTDSRDLHELSRIADKRMFQDKEQQRGARGGLERVLSLLTPGPVQAGSAFRTTSSE